LLPTHSRVTVRGLFVALSTVAGLPPTFGVRFTPARLRPRVYQARHAGRVALAHPTVGASVAVRYVAGPGDGTKEPHVIAK
jgi:hypothetical protein